MVMIRSRGLYIIWFVKIKQNKTSKVKKRPTRFWTNVDNNCAILYDTRLQTGNHHCFNARKARQQRCKGKAALFNCGQMLFPAAGPSLLSVLFILCNLTVLVLRCTLEQVCSMRKRWQEISAMESENKPLRLYEKAATVERKKIYF